MTKNEFEWLTEDHEFKNIEHHQSPKVGMSNEEYDNWLAMSYGYEDATDMQHRNYIKDKLCIIHHGNYCKRNK